MTRKELSVKYLGKIFGKTNISPPPPPPPLIRPRTGAYQGVGGAAGVEMLVFRKVLRRYLMDDP